MLSSSIAPCCGDVAWYSVGHRAPAAAFPSSSTTNELPGTGTPRPRSPIFEAFGETYVGSDGVLESESSGLCSSHIVPPALGAAFAPLTSTWSVTASGRELT